MPKHTHSLILKERAEREREAAGAAKRKAPKEWVEAPLTQTYRYKSRRQAKAAENVCAIEAEERKHVELRTTLKLQEKIAAQLTAERIEREKITAQLIAERKEHEKMLNYQTLELDNITLKEEKTELEEENGTLKKKNAELEALLTEAHKTIADLREKVEAGKRFKEKVMMHMKQFEKLL